MAYSRTPSFDDLLTYQEPPDDPGINKKWNKAMTKAATVPKTITDPANLNIFVPIPSTIPSLRCSIAAEAMELANPVTGTADPAPAHWAILS
ncbi:hypothetical protein D3C81_1968720 [compost metagenome]